MKDRFISTITSGLIPYSLPENWSWFFWEDIMKSYQQGMIRSNSQLGSGNVSYLKMGDIDSSGTANLTNLKRTDASNKEIKEFELGEGDFLINVRNSLDLVGKTCVVDKISDNTTLFNHMLVRIDNGSPELNYFLNAYLNTPVSRKLINRIKEGTTTVIALYQREINKLPVALPDKVTFDGIVRIYKSIRLKIELNNRIKTELEAMAKTLYDYWFVQFEFPISAEQAAAMGQPQLKGKPYKSSGGKMVWNKELKREIPAGWEVGTLSDIIELNYGKPLKKEVRTGNGFPVVGSGGIVGYHDEPIVAGPGIVVGRKGTVGCITYLHENFFPIDTSYFVQPKVEIKFMYLLHLLNTLRLNSMNSDSAVPGLNRERALGVSIVLVPQKLIRHFESIVEPFFNKMLNSNQQNQQLASLRDWLLPMLMNGQVKVGVAGSKAYTASEGMDVAAEPERKY